MSENSVDPPLDSVPVADIDNVVNSVPIVKNIIDCPNSGACLLCISDLEGCQLKAPSKLDQHTHFCSDEFFDALEKAMRKNDEMQIVFLGDYFDQGPHMINSITKIVKLYNNYNGNETAKHRVHIILGNRDVNKLRIPLEAELPAEEINSFTWIGDKKTNRLPDNSTPFEKTKQLIGVPPSSNTYGASDLFKNLAAELNNINDISTVTLQQEEDAFNLFNQIFQIKSGNLDNVKKEFVDAVKFLFANGKLIKIINIGGTKFLASHAGTIHECVFNNTLLKNIVNNNDDKIELTNYFDNIERIRQMLEVDDNKSNTEDVDNKSNTEEMTVEEAEKKEEEAKEEAEKYNIDESIKNYNAILSSVVALSIPGIVNMYNNTGNTYNNSTEGTNNFKKKYFLLQALGLKSTMPNPKPFASPIESCGVNSCTHFTVPTTKFKTLLTDAGITGCIHGHKPFCGTVPLIFKDGDFVEIACDTSNGNRPNLFNDTEVALDQVPLAIVYPDGAGITSIDNDGILSNKDTLGLSNDGKNNDFKPIIRYFPFASDDFPTLSANEKGEMKLIKYPDGNFKLNGHTPGNFGTMFIPSTFESPKYSTTEAEGGKRKTRRHKITKNKNKRNNKKGKTLRNKRRTIRKK